VGLSSLLSLSVRSMLNSAGTRDAAQVAYYLVMSFPALLLLLVWGFSAVLQDNSVREEIVDAIMHGLPIADPSDRNQVERLLDDVAAGAGGLGWLGAVALLLGLLTCLFVILPETPKATWRTAWPGALVTVLAVVAIKFGADVYFDVVGNSNAVYGTMGVLLAVVFAAYLIALAVVLGAHVSAAAGRPAEEPDGPRAPLGRSIANAVRGLFVRDRRA